MSKQRPNPDKIANELRGASGFFQRSTEPATPAPDPTNESPAATMPPAATRTPDQTRTPVRPGRPRKRQMIRHPFELYMDQLDRLRELAEEQRRRGEPGSMSKMVRDAIDHLLDHPPSPD